MNTITCLIFMKIKLTSELKGKVKHFDTSHCEIHIVDYSEKTKFERGVEVCDSKPEDIDSLKLINDAKHQITTTVFEDNCFLDESKKAIPHCEGIVYPSNVSFESWILFVEIKDCKPKNISRYFEKAKSQIIETVKIFRTSHFIHPDRKVHAVISFPQKNKADFYHHLIKQGERQNFLHQHKIIIKATNCMTIKSKKVII